MKKRLPIILVICVALVVVVAVAGFLFLGTIVKTGVEKVGPMITKVPVSLDGANISVFSGSGQLKGFVMGNPEAFKSKDSVRVGSVALKIEPGSVLRRMVGQPVFAVIMITIGLLFIIEQVITSIWGFDNLNLADPWGVDTFNVGDVVISALVVLNAAGDIVDWRQGALVAGARTADGRGRNRVGSRPDREHRG